MNADEQAILAYTPSLDIYVEGWIQSVYTSHSRSERTRSFYHKSLQNFRDILRNHGIDLNSQDHDQIAQLAEKWANTRSIKSRRKNMPIAQSTFNLRLAVISSFYIYIQEQLKLQGIVFNNPIDRIKRPKIQAYASAEPLDRDFIAEALASIDRRTPTGKRDYAILAIGLRTGRRAHELINLRARHLTFNGSKVKILFEHCKGGKVMRDTLDPDITRVLLEYLFSVYGADLEDFAGESPVWVSFSRQNKGKAMGIHALYDICEKYLQTTKIHALRHTFAHESEEEGAKTSDIQHRLGHESLNQTGTYLKSLKSDENPIGERLTRRFGIKPLGM